MAKSDAGEQATAMNSGTTFTVSLLRSKKTGDVLFLEAGKDFVDTLISFLLLPVGTVLHLLSNVPIRYPGQYKQKPEFGNFNERSETAPSQRKPLGGISGIFASMGYLDSSLLHVDRKDLVEPKPAAIGTSGATGLLKCLKTANASSPYELVVPLLPTVYYRCNVPACTSLSLHLGTPCEKCLRAGYGTQYAHKMEMTLLDADLGSLKAKIKKTLGDPDDEVTVSPSGQGFVRESITYMVTDSLEIMPSTTIRSIKVLNNLKVATLADLESNDVSVDITQVLQLLRSAMTSRTCLNDVFGKI